MNFLIGLDSKFSTMWRRTTAYSNFASEILDHKYQEEYAAMAREAFVQRTEIISQLEGTYLDPILSLRNQYNWRFISAHGVLFLDVAESLSNMQLEFMKQKGISFVADNGEHSDDKFGNSEMFDKLLKDYKATEPQRMGFN